MNAPVQSPRNSSTQLSDESSFEKESQKRSPSMIAEFVDFLVHNKKWWLAPIILILLVVSLFVVLTNTAVGPFIYVLF